MPLDGYTCPLEGKNFLNITVNIKNPGPGTWKKGTILKNGYYIASAVQPIETIKPVAQGDTYKFEMIVMKPS